MRGAGPPLALLALFALSRAAAASPPPRLYTYRVLKAYPHDASSFTQGLLVRGRAL